MRWKAMRELDLFSLEKKRSPCLTSLGVTQRVGTDSSQASTAKGNNYTMLQGKFQINTRKLLTVKVVEH